MNWYITVLKNYVGFEGRAQRAEYWYFTLINLIAGLIFSYVSPTLQAVYALAVFLPALAVAVRRLHDTERSGWWLLLIFLPLIGAIILIIFLVQDSTPETTPTAQTQKANWTRYSKARRTRNPPERGPACC